MLGSLWVPRGKKTPFNNRLIRMERTSWFERLRYCTRAGCLFRIACLLDQMRGDDAIDYPEHLARDQRTAGEEKTQQVWKAEHPLAHRLMGKYLIYQKGVSVQTTTSFPCG